MPVQAARIGTMDMESALKNYLAQKTPGKIRTTQNWIGPRGCTMQNATFIPPILEEVYGGAEDEH